MAKSKAVAAVGAVVPEVALIGAAAETAGNAVSKAGAAIKKPVWGRERTLTYETEVERDGQIVKAVVVEHDSRQLGQGALAVGGLLALGAATVAAKIIGGTQKRLAARKESGNTTGAPPAGNPPPAPYTPPVAPGYIPGVPYYDPNAKNPLQ